MSLAGGDGRTCRLTKTPPATRVLFKESGCYGDPNRAATAGTCQSGAPGSERFVRKSELERRMGRHGVAETKWAAHTHEASTSSLQVRIELMLRITADVYSGQPNPVVEIADEGEARALLRELRQDPTLLSDAESTEGGLGFRGFHVEPLSDEIAQDFNIPSSLYLPARVLTHGGRAPEIAERLLDLMERGDAPALMEGATTLDAPLKDYLVGQLERLGRESAEDHAAPAEAE